MKIFACLIVTVLLIAACNNNKTDTAETIIDSATVVDKSFTWQAGLNDSTGALEMKKTILQGLDNSTVAAILNPVNQLYPEIKVDYIKTVADTVFLKIDDADFLTQQMGSAGASVYLAGLVYNITELPGIQYVNINFEEGDHAQPGTFTRKTFIPGK